MVKSVNTAMKGLSQIHKNPQEGIRDDLLMCNSLIKSVEIPKLIIYTFT